MISIVPATFRFRAEVKQRLAGAERGDDKEFRLLQTYVAAMSQGNRCYARVSLADGPTRVDSGRAIA